MCLYLFFYHLVEKVAGVQWTSVKLRSNAPVYIFVSRTTSVPVGGGNLKNKKQKNKKTKNKKKGH
jgi:hypothetical protein